MLKIKTTGKAKHVRLSLQRKGDHSGRIYLMAEDAKGEEWYILNISDTGVELNLSVPATLGIAVDKDGCVIMTKET